MSEYGDFRIGNRAFQLRAWSRWHWNALMGQSSLERGPKPCFSFPLDGWVSESKEVVQALFDDPAFDVELKRSKGVRDGEVRMSEVECPLSQRVDGKLHSWRFDGDDPYIICVYCDRMQDAITGHVFRIGRGVTEEDGDAIPSNDSNS